MSRDSSVTFEHIRAACYEILGRGERPSRPLVQALLETDRYIGRKGSNDLVQKKINEFWVGMAKTLAVSPRSVEGIPDAFVSVMDNALGEMVDIARQLAASDFVDKETTLAERSQAIEAALDAAREEKIAAEQSKTRAEGELFALQIHADELKTALTQSEQRVFEALERQNAAQKLIADKDEELKQRFVALELAQRTLNDANDQHRAETHRLMQQVDDVRQNAIQTSQKLTEQLEAARQESLALREAASNLRAELAQRSAEAAALLSVKDTLETALQASTAFLKTAEAKAETLQQDKLTLQVRYDTAESHRLETATLCAAQAETLGELRARVLQLEAVGAAR